MHLHKWMVAVDRNIEWKTIDYTEPWKWWHFERTERTSLFGSVFPSQDFYFGTFGDACVSVWVIFSNLFLFLFYFIRTFGLWNLLHLMCVGSSYCRSFSLTFYIRVWVIQKWICVDVWEVYTLVEPIIKTIEGR